MSSPWSLGRHVAQYFLIYLAIMVFLMTVMDVGLRLDQATLNVCEQLITRLSRTGLSSVVPPKAGIHASDYGAGSSVRVRKCLPADCKDEPKPNWERASFESARKTLRVATLYAEPNAGCQRDRFLNISGICGILHPESLV